MSENATKQEIIYRQYEEIEAIIAKLSLSDQATCIEMINLLIGSSCGYAVSTGCTPTLRRDNALHILTVPQPQKTTEQTPQT